MSLGRKIFWAFVALWLLLTAYLLFLSDRWASAAQTANAAAPAAVTAVHADAVTVTTTPTSFNPIQES